MNEPTVQEQDEFDSAFREARDREESIGRPDVAWAPQEGSQTKFLACPLFEVLYHGTRGPGKSDGLWASYAQFVGRGYGDAWRGIIFRKTYPQLADIVAKTHRWFSQIFTDARFNWSRMSWHFKSGEVLAFRHMAKPEDYWNYHGHEYPFIGWEELTAWPDDRCFTSMFSCCRSSREGVPKMIRSNTNPYGVGSNWIKERYRLHGQWWKTVVIDDEVDDKGNPVPARAAIHGHIDENKILLKADPDYKATILASAANDAMAKAWLYGSWDIIAGGMFDDVWSGSNTVPKFEIPETWRIDRAFDWGSSKPFSVGWYAESDGSDVFIPGVGWKATVRGDIFRVREWYGWTGRANQGLRMLATDVAAGIVERESMWGWRNGSESRVVAGPADSAIFTVENGVSIAMDMAKPIRLDGQVYPGVTWTQADKRSGSRKMGWEHMRKMMRNAQVFDGLPRERPGLFVVADENPQFLRTVLSLPRNEDDMDDVDTDSEDHIGDEVRYRVRASGARATQSKVTGYY